MISLDKIMNKCMKNFWFGFYNTVMLQNLNHQYKTLLFYGEFNGVRLSFE